MKKNIYRQAMLATMMASLSVTLVGCQLLGKRNDGSLAYQAVERLPPLQLPTNQPTAEFIPIYPTPVVGENTLQLTNESGTRYQLPPPPKTVR